MACDAIDSRPTDDALALRFGCFGGVAVLGLPPLQENVHGAQFRPSTPLAQQCLASAARTASIVVYS